jgi:hypothetical protein
VPRIVSFPFSNQTTPFYAKVWWKSKQLKLVKEPEDSTLLPTKPIIKYDHEPVLGSSYFSRLYDSV